MLKLEQKAKLIESRILDYEMKLFNLQIDKVAFEATEDHEQVKLVEQRIEALEKAKAAVENMKE